MATKKKAFRMRKRPAKPTRYNGQTKSKVIARGYGQIAASKLFKTLEKLSKDEGVPLSQIKYGYGTAHWTAPEPMEQYQKRLEKWQEKVNEWEKWAKDHAEEIKAHKKEKALKEAKKTAARIQSIKKRQDQLEDDLLVLKKKAVEEEQLLYELSQ